MLRLIALLCTAAVDRPSLEAFTFVARAQWDPQWPRKNSCHRYQSDWPRLQRWIVVHHSDFLEAPGPLGILDYHLTVSRYCDIAYHFVIGADGTIYEGRPLDVMGAHAGVTKEAAANSKSDAGRALDPDYGAIGVVLDGYFHDTAPTEHQLRALETIVHALRMRFAIPKDHVIAHREVRARLVEARGLTFVGEGTMCPGDRLMERVAAMREPEGGY
jgi:hypothetical protein